MHARAGVSVHIWESGECRQALVRMVSRADDLCLVSFGHTAVRQGLLSADAQRDERWVSMWRCRQGERRMAAMKVNERYRARLDHEAAVAAYDDEATDAPASDDEEDADAWVLHAIDRSGDIMDAISDTCQAASAKRVAFVHAPCGADIPEWCSGRRRPVPRSWYEKLGDNGQSIRVEMYEHSDARSWGRSLAREDAALKVITHAWKGWKVRRAARLDAQIRTLQEQWSAAARRLGLTQAHDDDSYVPKLTILSKPRSPMRRRRYVSHEVLENGQGIDRAMLRIQGSFQVTVQ